MKEKKSEAPRRGNEELFKWDGNPTFGQILPLAAQHVLAAVVGCVTPAILVANAANNAGGNVNDHFRGVTKMIKFECKREIKRV